MPRAPKHHPHMKTIKAVITMMPHFHLIIIILVVIIIEIFHVVTGAVATTVMRTTPSTIAKVFCFIIRQIVLLVADVDWNSI